MRKPFQICFLVLFASFTNAQSAFFSYKAQKLIGIFNLYHVSPPPNDGRVSEQILDLFISELDNSGLILKEPDVNLLLKDKNRLFEEINSGKDERVTQAQSVFTKALASLDSILVNITSRPLNFTENDTIFFLPFSAKRVYARNIKEHARRVERWIKYKSYDRVSNTESYDKLTETEFNAKALEFSKSIVSSLRKTLKKKMNESYSIVESTLLNAMCQRYDPHSNYFTGEQNKEFVTQLSSNTESFGFQLAENDDDMIAIVYIEPGGSAWLSNEVNEGDLFISAKLGNALIRNEDNNAADIQKTIDNSPEKKILLTLKRPNGLLKTVTLVKQKTEVEENSVMGYILRSNDLKLGYVSLPSFYTNMGENLPGCANDVAKEILKLEKDTIGGLIIDLRNNGGGSMQEAINLAGIFIDEGPLFIYKEKNRKPSLVKDINRGSIFKKPLVVMINETSASASELFCNIIKDYNSGLIVGQSSYGKGTAQIILPLDTNLRDNMNDPRINDFIKITTGRFYRLNCSSHQGQGVSPDVMFQSLAGSADYKENKEKYYLLPDSVVKKLVYSPNPPVNSDGIRAESLKRMAASKEFNRLKIVSDSLSSVINTTQKIKLTFSHYKKYKADLDRLYTVFENSLEAKTNVTCTNNTFDKKLNEISPEIIDFNSKVLASIEKDIFISESFYVLRDLINQEKK